MSFNSNLAKRSLKRIGKVHLKALGKIAQDDIQYLLVRSDRFRRAYNHRLIAVTLCQGAALHYIDGANGVKDFDVWSWWASHDSDLSRAVEYQFPYRRIKTVDSARYDRCFQGFGVRPEDLDCGYRGRRIDLLMREIPYIASATNIDDRTLAIRDYLNNGKTDSARELSAKGVIGIWPKSILGAQIWPVT